MATPLTAAHRTWRTKIFAATWLSYVGFYFCRKPFSAAKSPISDELGWSTEDISTIWAAYLFAYALGQFLASQLGPRLGPRRNVLIGMAASTLVTLAMGISPSIPVMTGLVVINGLAQATGWSGNVGTMAGWFHRHERGKVMGAWSSNFIVGSVASGFAMAGVLGVHGVDEPPPWRWCFYLGGLVLAVVWVVFFFLQRNRPEDVGLAAIDDPATDVDEATTPEPVGDGWLGLPRASWRNLLLVAGFYFFAKFIRYAVWSWAPFFMVETYGLSNARANLYATAFDIFGIAGAFATGWLSDKFFASRRAGVSLLMMLGMVVATALLFALRESGVAVFILMLGLVGFTLYGPDALLSGAGAVDIGGRRLATFAAAFISGIGSLGPVVQEVMIGKLYDKKTGELGPVLIVLFVSATLAAAFCAALVWRNRRGGKGI
ncbi:MAG: MFS transporter [Kofleriaceae bacterium]|nr:MFS transporter [Kofleriaceae bacterium]MBP9206866.1 MFS transporter [Kofleriaceae bacterium]